MNSGTASALGRTRSRCVAILATCVFVVGLGATLPPGSAAADTAVSSATIALAPPYRAVGRYMYDRHGRIVFFHGVNAVYKPRPYVVPSAENGVPLDQSLFDDRDGAFLARNGLNAVRYGVMWAGVQPAPNAYDATYVSQIRNIMEMLGRHQVGVLVESHQDMWNEAYRGVGMPDWTRLDQGTRITHVGGFPANYVSPSSQAMWEDFWANRANLWGRFRDQWVYVAWNMRDLPNLIGYDIFNEPWPGRALALCASPLGCVARDYQSQRMQELAIAGIRTVDMQTPVWWEGNLLTDFGLANKVGVRRPIHDPASNTVLSFHAYCALGTSHLFGLRPGTDPTCNATHDSVFRVAEQAGARNDSPPVLTEFAASDDLTDIDRITRMADQQMMSWFYWGYGGWRDHTGGPDMQGLFTDDYVRTDATLKQGKADLLVRTYPQAIAGVPQRYSFQPRRADRRFTFSYASNPKIAAPTVVFVPERHYPTGYDTFVTGPARVTSAPDARLLTLETTGAPGIVNVFVRRHQA